MKLKTTIVCLLAFVFNELNSQNNLVINPSFEEYSECPLFFSEIEKVLHWDNLSVTNSVCNADLFSVCSPTNSEVHVPNYISPIGTTNFQYPRTGGNYILIEVYGINFNPNWRNYLKGVLKDTLKYNMNYCAKMYTNLSNMSKFKVNKIGIVFDNNTLPTNNDACWALNINPNISSNPAVMLDDTLGWMKIEGVYTANGTETNIVIGNFSSDANTIAQSTFFLQDIQ